jgi:spore coat protein CotF
MIDVKSFVAVAGMSGVQKLIAVRSNGLIIENFDSKERKFVPMRSHEFSPFETISVYIDGGDTVTLAQVITNMKAQLEENPLPSEKDASPVLRNYLIKILPEHDRDRVHISDIKKMIKWFNFLNSRDLLQETVVEEVAEAATEAAPEAPTEEKVEA